MHWKTPTKSIPIDRMSKCLFEASGTFLRNPTKGFNGCLDELIPATPGRAHPSQRSLQHVWTRDDPTSCVDVAERNGKDRSIRPRHPTSPVIETCFSSHTPSHPFDFPVQVTCPTGPLPTSPLPGPPLPPLRGSRPDGRGAAGAPRWRNGCGRKGGWPKEKE